MRVISRRALREFWETHSTAETGLLLWYERVSNADFQGFNSLRQIFPSADLVGNFTVFNISGNNFRLITYIDYQYQIIFIRAVLTHANTTRRTGKMTTGLKTPSSYYMELINAFPPRPITNEVELAATQERINALLDQGKLTQDDRDYLKILGVLVYDYEEYHEVFPQLTGNRLLHALLEESNLQPADLVPIFGSEAILLEVLNGQRELEDDQINQLADFFHISPTAFKKKYSSFGLDEVHKKQASQGF